MVRGRPPGNGPTVFWTEAEREIVQKALDDLAERLPHRTPRAIIQMMLRMDDGEFE